MNLSDRAISWIRTAVPIWVGVGVAWLATKTGIVLDAETSAALGALVAGIVAQLYYTLARWVETKYPNLGWLLGYSKTPVYAAPNAEVKVDGQQVR